MREDAFRAFLAPRLGRATVGSYLSNARTVERTLKVDLDQIDLSNEALENLGRRLINAGVPKARAGDCRSALARYRQMDGVEPGGAEPEHGKHVVRERAESLRSASVAELMAIYADLLDELRDRKVIRTANGPVGDYAELLFSQAFGWALESNAACGFGARGADGTRYQIKARRLVNEATSRQLSALRDLPARPFDILAAVLLDADCGVRRAALIPYEVVVGLAPRVEHTNSWRLMLADRVWGVAGVTDVTERLRTAVAGL